MVRLVRSLILRECWRDCDGAFAPDSLTADAGPLGEVQEGNKFRNWAFVLGFTDEASERVALAGSGAAPVCFDMGDLAARDLDVGGALTEGVEVDGERSIAVELAECADTVANTGGEHGEVWRRGEPVIAFQFCRRKEPDVHARYGGGRGSQLELDGRQVGRCFERKAFLELGDLEKLDFAALGP